MPIESDERISECFEFDLGHYPLTPWLNKSDDPLLKDLKRYNFFLPPKVKKDELFIVSLGECSPLFEFHPLQEPALLSKSGLLIDDFEACIGRINAVIGPLRSKHSFNERLILFYILFGILIVTTIAVILGINYSYIYPLVLTILYFAGFAYLVYKVQRANYTLLK